MQRILALGWAAAVAATPLAAEIRIAHVYGKTGALEAYAAAERASGFDPRSGWAGNRM